MSFKQTRRIALASMVLGLAAVAIPAVGGASGTPSGQRMYGNTTFDATTGHFVGGGGTIEPAIDDANGNVVYIQTPNGAHAHPNDHNVAPIYLPVYPIASGIDPTTLDCAHVPLDNCADHGPEVSAAVSGSPVYASGVAGHDHLLGIAKSGGDFNVLWEPTLVVFNSVQASTTHVTTLAQINALVASNQAFLVPLPQLDFHCSVVSAASYNRATPGPSI
jgi:hypothetical protein